jgi:hypothetical protein
MSTKLAIREILIMETVSLYNWEDNVESFFAWADYWCGASGDTELLTLLRMTVNTEKDLADFIELYDGQIDNLEFTAYKMLSEIN